MGAAIGHAQHGGGIGDHLMHHIEAAGGIVLERQHQQALAALREDRFEGDFLRRAAGPLGDGGNRVGEIGLVVRPVGDGEHLVECFAHVGRRTADARGEQAPAQIGIGRETFVACGGRQVAQLAPHGVGRERMNGRLEPHDHADRPASDLGIGLVARRTHAMDVG